MSVETTGVKLRILSSKLVDTNRVKRIQRNPTIPPAATELRKNVE
jgi:hypothetical protein